jgi:hypothetical protein
MEPIEFNEQMHVLQKPEGMTDEECGPLPVYVADGVITSCWRPTWRERISMLIFGRVWVWVCSGETQPPIALEGKRTVFKYKKA